MTPLRRALGRVPPEIIFIAGSVGFLVPTFALVTAEGGLALAGAALPGWSSCSLWDCVGQALDNLLSIPGALFGGSAVTVGTAITVGGIGGATYGDGLGSGGNMGTEGERLRGDRQMERDSVVYDDHGREIPGTRVPEGTRMHTTRTIYAPNGNPMFNRVYFYPGQLPPGAPSTGWVEAKDTRPTPYPETIWATRG